MKTERIKLTAAQFAVIKNAANRADGNLEPLPPTLRGSARDKVIAALLARELICKFHYPDRVEYYLTNAGFAAAGHKHKLQEPVAKDQEIKVAASAAEANKPRTRQNSKQALVIEMLKRPEGATIAQISEATGWQHHTIRGIFAGALKKKLGLAITSEKPYGGERIYRIR